MILPRVYFLRDNEQLLIERLTQRSVINGPAVAFTHPLDRAVVREAIRLTARQYLLLEDLLTGERRIERGPGLVFQQANELTIKLCDAVTLEKNDYLLIRDTLSGELKTVRGPRLFFPAADEEIIEKRRAIPLKANQYLRIMDQTTGNIRIERGEALVFLEPAEKEIKGVKDGVNIDQHNAAIVLDTCTGQLELIQTPQLFIPEAYQEVVSMIKRICLEAHETVVIRDPEGRFIFRRGTDVEPSFFLPPYHELVTFTWSTGLTKDQRNFRIERIDSRPKFMAYGFEARTRDNVELKMEISFFWQIVDVEAMVMATDDVPGDICFHARSGILQSISQVTLETFLDTFNSLIHDAVLGHDDPFYAGRGVRLHAVEVRSVTCKDPDTNRILQDIIRETTGRISRLQKQQGESEILLQQRENENEIMLKQLAGEIEAESLRARLLEARVENDRRAALTAGEAEALQVRAFFDSLGDGLTNEQKTALFNTLRKQDAIEALSQGTAQMYFTPADIDLSIETRNTPRT